MKTKRIHLCLKLIAISVIFLMACEREICETCGDIPTDGLVSYYVFQGDANDNVGSNHGIENNVEYFENIPMSPNKVLMLNGVDSYVDLENPFDFEVMTISLWFNALDFESIFDLIYTSDNPDLQYGLLSIAVRNDEGVDNLYFNFSGNNVTVAVNKNTWYHVTVIKDKKDFKYYLNAELIEAGSTENYITSDDGPQTAVVGCKRTYENGYFYGFIDNLRIYNKVLSEKEIKKIFDCQE
jgi:hypothetical protein